MYSKSDIHVHSKYSDNPSEWYLKQINAAESYVEPIQVYNTAKQRGMQFVTISDHDRIDGALELANLKDTFISAEATLTFPEDGCKIHCLVTGITEKQWAEIDNRRDDIYAFQKYVRQQNIIHSVAHPLFTVNGQMTIEHFEKLLLLFNRFEAINGARDARAGTIVRSIMENLTANQLTQMQQRHQIDPYGDKPWQKVFTGGSDDHSGEFIGAAYTATPKTENVNQYLDYLRAGKHLCGGSHGGSLRLSHSLVAIARKYVQKNMLATSDSTGTVLDEILQLLMEQDFPDSRSPDNRRHSQKVTIGGNASASEPADELDWCTGIEEGTMDRANEMFNECWGQLIENVCDSLASKKFQNIVTAAPSLMPIALSALPYLAAVATNYKDEKLCQEVSDKFSASRHLKKRGRKKLWLTDNLSNENGISVSIARLAENANLKAKDLTVMTCLPEKPNASFPIKNVKPVYQLNLPFFDQFKTCIPPILEVIRFIEQEPISELIISTPGPLGLVGLMAAKLLNLPVRALYQTDFPARVRSLTESETYTEATRKYMQWFYSNANTVLAPSEFYRDSLVSDGLDAAKVKLLPQGVDSSFFNPVKKDVHFWKERGMKQEFTFLYAGRMSREKNVEHLIHSFLNLTANLEEPIKANLGLCGDGPQLSYLRDKYAGNEDIQFTGCLDSEELAIAYASSDVFVFPSTTDTFGNVVLEAQACGLPAIVSNMGGPAEIVMHNGSGLIVDLSYEMALASAMKQLYSDDIMRGDMRNRAILNAEQRSWNSILDLLWNCAEKQLQPPQPRTENDSPLKGAMTPINRISSETPWDSEELSGQSTKPFQGSSSNH